VTGASHAIPVRGWQQDGDEALGSFQVSFLIFLIGDRHGNHMIGGRIYAVVDPQA
jgi:hypothetical protein